MKQMDDSRYVEGIVPVEVALGSLVMHGDLAVPAGATGLVVMAHGPGSSRASPRVRFEAAQLRQHGLGTLVMDLLSQAEERLDAADGRWRVDGRCLSGRLGDAAAWLARTSERSERGVPRAERRSRPSTAGADRRTESARGLARHPGNPGLPIGVFGVGLAAAPALALAGSRPDLAGAVVCRSPALAIPASVLEEVRVPVLIVCGELDEPGLERAHHALMHLERGGAQLEIVRGAAHEFEEPGKLEEACALAGAWFGRWLPGRRAAHA